MILYKFIFSTKTACHNYAKLEDGNNIQTVDASLDWDPITIRKIEYFLGKNEHFKHY